MPVEIKGKELSIKQWRTTSSEVVVFFQDVEPEAREVALEQALKVGCLALKNAGAAVNVDYIEKEFLKLSQQLETGIDQRVKLVTAALEEVFRSEDGVLRRELEAYLGSGGKLADFFDPVKRDSAVSRMSEIMDKHFGANGSVLQKLLDCTEAGSPLAKLKGGMDEQIKELAKAIGELRKEIAVKGAREEEYEKGTRKGMDFEQAVLGEIEKVAAIYGDTVFCTGGELGLLVNSKAGDIVVEVKPADCKGRKVSIVFEAKDRKKTVKSILEELDKAKENRAARAGVAVFSREENLPAGVGAFRDYHGNRFICTLNKETFDPMALQMAYKIARLFALMEEPDQEQGVRPEMVRDSIKKIQTKLSLITTTKKRLTQGKGLLDTVAGDLEMLRTEILNSLSELEESLGPSSKEETVA